jgi:hypothetical protein
VGRLTVNSFYWQDAGYEDEYAHYKAHAEPKIADAMPFLRAQQGHGQAQAYLGKNRGMELASATAGLTSPFVRRFVEMLGQKEWLAAVERAKGTIAKRRIPPLHREAPLGSPPAHDEA